MGLAPALVAGELLVLLALVTPVGDQAIRGVSLLLRRRFDLTVPERALFGLYGGGGILYAIASLPIDGFSTFVLAGVIGVSWTFALEERLRRGRFEELRKYLRRGTSWAVVGAFVGLLAFEVTIASGSSFPNAFDGSVQGVFVRSLIDFGHTPSMLAPWSPSSGVVYPQGAAVWFGTAALLLRWSVLDSVVQLPALFLALAPVAAAIWGGRLDAEAPHSERTAAVFAVMWATVVSWPRFLLVGSYDFVFALPLMMALLARAPSVSPIGRPARGSTVALGAAMAVVASLSPVAVAFLAVAWIASAFVPRKALQESFRRIGRTALAVAIGALALLPGAVRMVSWWEYPAHVETPIGPGGTYVPAPSALGWSAVVSDLDPFVAWTEKFSPVAFLAGLLLLLFLAGFVWLAASRLRWGPAWVRLPPGVVGGVTSFVVGAIALESILLAVAALWGPGFAPGGPFNEGSIVVFLGYSAIATVPLVGLARSTSPLPVVRRRPSAVSPEARRLPRPSGSAVALGIVAATFLAGIGGTVVWAPSALHAYPVHLANVTAGDAAALEWTGANLPGCAVVFVAPGSAAEFLPLYSLVHVDFPMNPTPLSVDYQSALRDLTGGNYTSTTRADLEQLGVTDVFVTGSTDYLWAPLDPAPLERSTDFQILFHDADAFVFAFAPLAASTTCAR